MFPKLAQPLKNLLSTENSTEADRWQSSNRGTKLRSFIFLLQTVLLKFAYLRSY